MSTESDALSVRGWTTQPLKRVAITFSGAGFPLEEQGLEGEEIPFHKVASLSGASAEGYIERSPDTISKATAASLRAPILRRGSIVIAKIGAALLLGRIRQLAQAATIDNNMLGIVPTGAVDRFVYYSMQTVPFHALVNPGAVPSLSDRNLRMWKLAVPPLSEQEQIAEYLDRETAKIDDLIAKEQLLVEMLTERRQASILQGVTRGLDEAVAMKDSPAAWTTKIPAHWSGGNIRRFALMKTGHTPSRTHPEFWEECNTPWFTLADVWQLRKGQRYLGDTAEKISEVGLANSAAELLPSGTVVLSRTASVGFVGIMPRPMATSQDYWNWVPGPKLTSDYLYLQLLAMRPHLMSLMRGSTHMTIYQSTAASLSLVVPPLDEQKAIVHAVDRELAKGAALIEAAERGIVLLRERRQALIGAAITGKIDVRVL